MINALKAILLTLAFIFLWNLTKRLDQRGADAAGLIPMKPVAFAVSPGRTDGSVAPSPILHV